MIDETVRQVEEMQTQSASIVAIKAAEALRELTEREYRTVEEFLRSLERNSSALLRANRSHAPLYTTQQRIVEAVTQADVDSVEAGKAALVDAIEDVVEEVESSKQRAAERAARLFNDGDVVLTHENSSTVMATFDEIRGDGKELEAYVTESRPRFLGRKTARQLAERDGVAATLITDGAAGHYFAEVDRVLIGMNCLIDDVLYNRIGTHSVVASAASHGVPVTAVGSSSKFIGSGFTFENTFRPTSEVMLEPAEGFDVANPGYDATPTRLLDSVVTDEGVESY